MARFFLTFIVCVAMTPSWAGNWNGGGKVNTDRNSCLDEKSSSKPTLEQLVAAHIYCHQRRFSKNGRLMVQPSGSPKSLEKNVQFDPYLSKQMETTGLISYLLYKDGRIVRDSISPANRLGYMLNEKTRLVSNSVGKSFTAYLLGHSICRGDIPSLDHDLSDWPLLRNTLYANQKLIDVVNMNVGDRSFFQSQRVQFKNSRNKKGVNHETIKYWGEELKGTKPPWSRSFNYSQFLSGLTTNYVAFKARDGFDQLLAEVYADKVGIEHPLTIGYVDPLAHDDDGKLSNQVWASRHDYLRIAIAMLDDWRADNCVGQYLKELYQRRLKALPPKSDGRHHRLFRKNSHKYQRDYDYGGFFHINPSKTDDIVFVMHGFGGQIVAINFDTGTIVVAHSAYENWDTARLVIDAVNG